MASPVVAEAEAAAATVLLPCEDDTAWAAAKAGLLTPAFASFDAFNRALARHGRWLLGPETKEEEPLSDTIPPEDVLLALRKCVENRDGGEPQFVQELLPFIQQEALQLPQRLAGRRLPVLLPGVEAAAELPRPLVGSLLACAFFGLYRAQRVRGGPKQDMPEANWDTLLRCCPNHVPFVLHYFQRLKQAAPAGVLRVHRKVLGPTLGAEAWRGSAAPLVDVEVRGEGGIEDAPRMLQADFANEYLGGGVLHGGNVQEEIRFLLSPECLAAMLLCPRMEANEAILLCGAERFSRHTGYGGRLRWKEDFVDTHKSDSGQPLTAIVAFDALMLEGEEQYTTPTKLRELNKAFIAFRAMPEEPAPELGPVATGNWGCGMFGGCRHLKFVLQWLAASHAGRPLCYFLFDETRLADRIEALLDAARQAAARQRAPVTVGQLARLVFATEFEMRREFLPWLTDRLRATAPEPPLGSPEPPPPATSSPPPDASETAPA